LTRYAKGGIIKISKDLLAFFVLGLLPKTGRRGSDDEPRTKSQTPPPYAQVPEAPEAG